MISARVTLAVVGLAAAVYATASLMGGWLGTPPWWETTVEVRSTPYLEGHVVVEAGTGKVLSWGQPEIRRQSREGREAISGLIAAVGYALFAAAAWRARGGRRDRNGLGSSPGSHGSA